MTTRRAHRTRTSLTTALAAALTAGALAACSSDPEPTETQAERSRFNERVFEERASFKLVRDGDRAAERGQPELAAEHYRAAIAQHSGNFEARRKLAEILLDEGQDIEALAQLRIVRTEFPGDAEILDMMAEALARTGDAEALEREIGGRARDTNDARDWLRYARALVVLGDADRADRAFVRAAEADGGKRIEYQLAIAGFAESVGDSARALRRYRMALYLDVTSEAAQEGIRGLGRVPGPSYALVPEEAR